MKFGQLIEYITRNIFREKSYTKCGGETIPRPFLKSQKQAYLWLKSVLYNFTLLYTKLRAILPY